MVSDGLSFINAEFSATSFRVLPVTIGKRNFLGNNIAYPAGARTGDNCLIATKAMIPIAGPGPRRGRAARLALLRDPPHGPAGPPLRPPRHRTRTATPAGRQEPVQRRHHRLVPAGALGLRLRAWRSSRCWTPAAAARPDVAQHHLRRIMLGLAFTVGYFVLAERAVTGFRAPPAAVLLDLPARRSGGTSGTGRYPPPLYLHRCSTARPSRASSGGCSAYGSAAGSSTTAATSSSGPWSASAATARSNAASVRARPLPGRRHLQIRPHHHRDRLHHRHRRLRPLRRHHGRRRGPRHRFLPDERRTHPAARTMAGQPRRQHA